VESLDILAEAERRTGLSTNAVTAFHEKSGTTVLVFRDPATATRAEVLEELRHLEWARAGNWNKDLPGVFTAFELRELDAAAHFRNLLEQGKITAAEFDETIRNLAHHLSRPGKPVTEAQARSLLEGLTQ
jgi:DNA-binding transcriptional ArsR family regulator